MILMKNRPSQNTNLLRKCYVYIGNCKKMPQTCAFQNFIIYNATTLQDFFIEIEENTGMKKNGW